MTVRSGRTAIAVVTSALGNLEGFLAEDREATGRYLDDVRALIAELPPSEIGFVMLKLGTMVASLIRELAQERGGDPSELLQLIALTTQEES